jgi:hypothetical protein
MIAPTTIVDMGNIVSSNIHGLGQPETVDQHSSTSSMNEDDHSLSSSAEGSSQHNNDSDNVRSSQVTGSTGQNTGENIFTKDGGALSGARCCFILVLLATACTLAVVVNVIFTNEKTRDFEAQVSSFVEKEGERMDSHLSLSLVLESSLMMSRYKSLTQPMPIWIVSFIP